MSRLVVLPGLNAADHRGHVLHGPERIWVEKNCYADLWIELLHAKGLEPRAAMPFVFAMDFEGDQWTFFKPALSDLRALYGIDVQELTVWLPVIEHAVEHLSAGKLLSVEVDAFWLPDTAGTDYRHSHGKTTIVLNELDLEARRLGYFHNAAYCALEGEDFAQLFDTSPLLPPYTELIRIDRVVKHPEAVLRARSIALFREHLAWRAADNPIARFRARFETDLPALQRIGLAHYHRYAFAGIRQLGAGAELAGDYLRWAFPGRSDDAATAFELVAQHAKTLILKAARAVNSGRALDAALLFDEMDAAWRRGMDGAINSAS